MNYANAGGWRFGNRPTSVEALYQPKPIDNDFLRKVAALQDPAKQGLLDQALTDKPLQGLLEAPGSDGMGDQSRGGTQAQSEGGYVVGPDGNTYKETSPAGMKVAFSPQNMKFSPSVLQTLASAFSMKNAPQSLDLAYYGNLAPWGNAAAAAAGGGLIGDLSFGGSPDYGLSPSGMGGYGPSLGNAAGLGLDPNNIGIGYGLDAFGLGGGSSLGGIGGLGAGGSPDGYW